jgi:uncharacterized protein YceK
LAELDDDAVADIAVVVVAVVLLVPGGGRVCRHDEKASAKSKHAMRTRQLMAPKQDSLKCLKLFLLVDEHDSCDGRRVGGYVIVVIIVVVILNGCQTRC